MTRKEFKQVIKAFSDWRIDRRKGNYKLPSGERLGAYLFRKIAVILDLHHMSIGKDGDIYDLVNGRLLVPFSESEAYDIGQEIDRIEALVRELIG